MNEPRKNRDIIYDSFLDPSIELYQGPFTFTPSQRKNDSLKQLIQRAYWSGTGQLNRTSRPYYGNYRYYGTKKVRYKLRDYISWYIHEANKFPKYMWPELVCGRIDHGDDYRFGNIQLETKTSNSLEVITRYKNQLKKSLLKPVEMTCDHCGVVMKRFSSITEFIESTGQTKHVAADLISGIKPKKTNLTYSLRTVKD